MSEALHDWTHLRLLYFKFIGEYNHEVHKISSKLRFCGKEPTDAEKIEKTLSTILPSDRILQQQYRARDYQVYSDLFISYFRRKSMMSYSLRMALSAWLVLNHYPKFIWMSRTSNSLMVSSKTSLRTPMVSESTNRNRKPRNSYHGKDTANHEFEITKLCDKCGCYTHPTNKWNTPKHLAILYQQSQGRKDLKGKRFEANFNLHSDNTNGAGRSQDVPSGRSNTMTLQQSEDPMSTENMMVEYASNDMYGDFN